MISTEELRAAIRNGEITTDEERKLWMALGEIAFRLWYEKLDREKAGKAK